MDTAFQNILDQLESDHYEIKELLEEARAVETEQRNSLIQELRQKLISHSRAEEKTFYAAILQRSHSTELKPIEESYDEHLLIDELLNDLVGLGVDDDAWLARVSVLEEKLMTHINEEETAVFELARTLFSKRELRALLKAFNGAKDEYMRSLPTQAMILEHLPSAAASRIAVDRHP